MYIRGRGLQACFFVGGTSGEREILAGRHRLFFPMDYYMLPVPGGLPSKNVKIMAPRRKSSPMDKRRLEAAYVAAWHHICQLYPPVASSGCVVFRLWFLFRSRGADCNVNGYICAYLVVYKISETRWQERVNWSRSSTSAYHVGRHHIHPMDGISAVSVAAWAAPGRVIRRRGGKALGGVR